MKSKTTDVIDYFDHNDQQMKSNDQWGDWEDPNSSNNHRYQQQYSNDRRRHHQQQPSDDLAQKSNDYNRTKQYSKTRSNSKRSSFHS
jgi:hypothetical protein